jgi:hypothetical protein
MHKMLSVIRDTEGIDVVHDLLEIVGPTLLAELGPGAPPVLHTLQWNLRVHQEFYRDFDGRGRVFFNGISEPQMEAAVGNLRDRHLGVVHNGVDVNDFSFREDKDEYVITLARFARDKGQDIAARVCQRLRLPLLMAGTVGGIASPGRLQSELSRRDSPFHDYKDVKYYCRSVRPYERRYPVRPWRGKLDYRLLPLNPGFSIVVINPGQRSGRVILELHGFQDPKVGDRMHIEIRRTESVPWFEYWAGRFEAIWDAAREPGADGRVALNRVPADRTDNPEARPQ